MQLQVGADVMDDGAVIWADDSMILSTTVAFLLSLFHLFLYLYIMVSVTIVCHVLFVITNIAIFDFLTTL